MTMVGAEEEKDRPTKLLKEKRASKHVAMYANV